ncbi:uncharacterized protein AB675_372 [Cyphellophora attinorum]|uniref:SnoaL-like domain-containing protein n=1 Tax=Cyphellophora attinorum TaxID=1664694 RepID=A0A0N1P241_9EURO|nr:uncharacterized protein AB675_372 [Phialophora attinorum]KPI45896.1 hypothetical protein AB675_372 [Phialophora attinorum]
MATQNTPRAKALTLISTFRALDSQTLVVLLHEKCVWTMFPTSLGFPPQTRDQQVSRLGEMYSSGILASFPVEPLEVIESVTQDGKAMVSVRCDGGIVLSERTRALLAEDKEGAQLLSGRNADSKAGRVDVRNEWHFTFFFDSSPEQDGGGKIERVWEFLDGEATQHLVKVLGRATTLVQGGD